MDKIKKIYEIMEKEIKERGFLDISDNISRYLDKTIENLIDEDDNIQDIEDQVIKLLKENFNLISRVDEAGNYKGYFTNKRFKKIENFEKYFEIGE